MWNYIKQQDNFGDKLEGSCKDCTIDFNLHFLFVTEEHHIGVSYLKIMKFVWKAPYFHTLEEAKDISYLELMINLSELKNIQQNFSKIK
jgi:hypothetical protein